MRLVLISDTHNLHECLSLPDGDVLVHAGDLTTRGSVPELMAATEWLNAQIGKFAHVVCIGGNHDFCLQHFMNEGAEDLMRHEIFQRVIYLRDSSVTLYGVKFYGTPWCPKHADNEWAWDVKRGPEMREKWALIPKDTDVLITHTPPYGVLDYCWQHRLGCEDLADRVTEIHPQVHVFGHIHNAYGTRLGAFDERFNQTQFFNATSTKIVDTLAGPAYQMGNAPLIVDL
jgi:Icc-related predicted phosphoesterase